ncbi:universal stress protein [Natranaeroarchaeum sulfidigenes]|uniref:Nucleotide-binding protein, UspA family n=1 Tax=Natranaeroarchaeum sulfidigenes TaxID=2784880 RepID=A0A897N1H9_9EURY|nr:universal stress protein [Natranaeroarchaeum sulfidigenes]QSG04186.1 Nucleotide-binding protein, UspA family [Natranaeroarchaeum sulfidigenes]
MNYLLGTDSVHTTASACDYLEARVDAADTVVAVHVQSAEDDTRDGREALNVATVRLGAIADVVTEQRTGDPAEELLASATDHDVDELIIGPRSGEPGSDSRAGSVATELLSQSSIPVVVVPLEAL